MLRNLRDQLTFRLVRPFQEKHFFKYNYKIFIMEYNWDSPFGRGLLILFGAFIYHQFSFVRKHLKAKTGSWASILSAGFARERTMGTEKTRKFFNFLNRPFSINIFGFYVLDSFLLENNPKISIIFKKYKILNWIFNNMVTA